MDVSLNEPQQEIREAVLKVCTGFGDEYWLERDKDGAFPHAFHRAFADGGGSALPCRRPTAGPGSASPRPPS